MRSWKTIFALLGLVIVLSVILGIKILNNTPEKQYQKFLNKVEENYEIEDYDTTGEGWKVLEKQIQKQTLKELSGYIVLIGIVILFFMIVNVKIYNKLGINELIINIYIISCIASFVTIFLFNDILSDITSAVSGIISLILLVMQYKVTGINPWLLLLIFVPVVGIFCIIILLIYGQSKLAAYFGKGTLFQLGLIFLPFIFLPILAFSTQE